MANPIYGSPNFSTTINVGGGITNSQTAGIVLTSVSGLNTGGGILGLTWASTIDTSTYEEIEYTGVSGNELTGVTRGVAGTSGKSHLNGATVVAVVSSLHNNRISDKLRSVDATAVQDPNGNEIIKTGYNASAVNEVTVTNAATANDPSIAATGGDTNIAIALSGKGTGAVKLGQATSAEVRLVADQPITDSSGNEFIKFSKTASAVNEPTITNAATGNNPIISATGGDTNISLDLRGKGTGLVKVTIQSDANGTPSQSNGGVFIRGWKRIQGGNSASATGSITYGVTLAAAAFPVVGSGPNGTAGTEAPTTAVIADGKIVCYGTNSATTGFDAIITHGDGTNVANTTYAVVNYFVLGVI